MKYMFLTLAVLAFTAVPADAQSTVVCESLDGKYRECRLEGVGVATLTRQLSDTNCIEGQSWGYRNGRIWVDQGCRAQFALTSRAASAPLDTRVVCESLDGKLNRCATATAAGVQMVRRISDSGCEFGRDWGYDRTGIWVTNGCRAEFAVTSSQYAAAPLATGMNSIVCESIDGRRNHCRADTAYGALLTRQMSDSACLYNSSWGIDQNGVWVTSGCRGEFALGDARMVRAGISTMTPGMISSAPALPATIVCESVNNGHQHCRADTRFGVTMLRQLSDAECRRDRSWGVDDVGIWVTNGCRAEFVLDRR